MKRAVTLLILLFTGLLSGAQIRNADSTAIDIAGVDDSSNISAHTFLYIDKSGSASLKDILNEPFSPLLPLWAHKRIPVDMIPYTFYCRFELVNSDTITRSIYVYPAPLYQDIQLYKLAGSPEAIANNKEISGARRLTLAAGEHCTVLMELKPVKQESDYINPQLINTGFIEAYQSTMQSQKNDLIRFGYVLSGILLMMILFMATNFILSGRKEFLYNALYSFCMFLLIFLTSYVTRTTTLFTNFFLSYIDFFLLATGNIFYLLFTRTFLNTRTKYVLLDKLLWYGEWLLVISIGLFTYLNFFTTGYALQLWVQNIMKLLMLCIGVSFVVLALQQRDRLWNYLAAGNAALIAFSIISLGLIWLKVVPVSIYSSSLFYYYIGIALELVFFLSGLTYKNRSELIERIKMEEAMKTEAERKDLETQIAIIKVQQEERDRISADMHDDLGAGVTAIRLYSELAKNKMGDQRVPEIDKISSFANDLLNNMNAIIWSMTSSNDSFGNMIAYIRSYAQEYCENTGMECHIHIPDDIPQVEVSGEIRRNVFLVVKEALHNIFKHAKASVITISLLLGREDVTLTIQDNGVGIDLVKLRQFGNGLKNMKKRMDDVGIDFSVENNQGTIITLHRRV